MFVKGLSVNADAYPYELSGGQQQMVSFTRNVAGTIILWTVE